MSLGFSHLDNAELETLHKSLHTDVKNPAVVEAHHSVTTEILTRGLEHNHENDIWNRAVIELEIENQVPVFEAISDMPEDIAQEVLSSLGNPEFVTKTTLLTVDGYTIKFDSFDYSMSKHQAGKHDQSSHGSWAPDTVPNVKDTQGKYSDEANSEASKLRKTVEQYEPELTEKMIKFSAKNSGKLEGLKDRLKTEESLARKIDKEAKQDFNGDRKKAAEKISDAVRYTSVFDASNYTAGVEETLNGLKDDGYMVDPKRIKNFWDTGDDYQGINAKVRHPSGFEFELQFHTPESLKVKKETHPHYEELRTAEDAKTKVKVYRRMIRMAKKVFIPAGVLAIGTLTSKPLIIGSQEILFKSIAILRFRGGGVNV